MDYIVAHPTRPAFLQFAQFDFSLLASLIKKDAGNRLVIGPPASKERENVSCDPNATAYIVSQKTL
jgi:hypothetical protein